ncbi:unnamed protein product, partial [Medioppia subpectinata]
KTFADWGVDMVKVDACFTPVHTLDKGFEDFSQTLNQTGRAMVYSCSWPYYQLHTSQVIPNWNLIADKCNIWRTYHDIHTNWKDILATIDFVGDNQEIFNRNVGPGRFNDPDMVCIQAFLLIGNEGLTVDQSRVQMGIWSIIAAPLFMSNDLRHIGREFKDILLNRDVIGVNQDRMARPGVRVFHNETLDIWLRPILPERKDTTGDQTSYAVAFVNRRTDSAISIGVRLQELGLKYKYLFRDLFDTENNVWEPKAMTGTDEIHVTIPSTGIRLFKAELDISSQSQDKQL